MKTTIATLSVALLAGASSAETFVLGSNIAPLITPVDASNIYTPPTFTSSSAGTARGTIGPVVTWPVIVSNDEGFDFGRVVIRIEPDPNETYAPGEFESITFAAPSTSDVSDSPIPGDIDAPFTVIDALLSDDGGFLGSGQRLDYVFDDSAPHAVGDALLYEFTINNPSETLYNFSFEFFPVPAPGSAALALGAIGLCVTRRRG